MTRKNQKFTFYLIITILLTLGLSISLQSLLAAWVAPTASPPSDNTPAPIYASGASQTITGDLGITGNLSAFHITANGDFYAMNHTIYMGGADWSIAFSPTYPDYGIFYDEGSPDKIVLSADGGGAADTDFVLYGDKVGIGTADPGAYKLNVDGDFITSGGGNAKITGGGAFGGYDPSTTHKVTTPTLYAEQAQVGNPAGGLKGAGSLNASTLCIDGVCQPDWTGVGGTSGWTDDGGTVRLTSNTDQVGIGMDLTEAKAHILNEDSADSFRVDDVLGDTTPFIIDKDGNVGIGDSSPDSGLKLDVEGRVGATEYCDESGGNCFDPADSADWQKFIIDVNGVCNNYYQVVLHGGNQNKMRRIRIYRSYSTDPDGHVCYDNDASPGSHVNGLVAEIHANFGGWGGQAYKWEIDRYGYAYDIGIADAGFTNHNIAFYVMLLGGYNNGEDPMRYYIEVDEPVSSVNVYYSSSELTYDHSNPIYDVYALDPITSVNWSNLYSHWSLTGRGIYSNNGKVGIGFTDPLAKLAINGGLHVGGTSDPGNDNLIVDGNIQVNGDIHLANGKSFYVNLSGNDSNFYIGNYTDNGGAFSFSGNRANLTIEGYVNADGLCIEDDCKYSWNDLVQAGCSACDTRFVNVTGDTMTGALTVNSTLRGYNIYADRGRLYLDDITNAQNGRIDWYAADGDTGYIQYTTSDRWEWNNGSFYLTGAVPATYLYSANTYLGASSGDTIHTRGNVINIGANSSGQDGDLRIINYTANAVSDGIKFYEGGTRVGEIGVEDTSWLRINQETAKNIYTPRMFRADGGIRVSDDEGWYRSAEDMLAPVNDSIDMLNYNIHNINYLSINDPGDQEGIIWNGSAAKIFVSPLDSGNADGYLRLINDGGIVFEPGAEDTEVMTLTAAGGVHIGGTSDPGADNLIVDGKMAVGGDYAIDAFYNITTPGIYANQGEFTKLCIGGGDGSNCKASWADINTSGWTDDGGTVRLTSNTDQVGIGMDLTEAKAHILNEDSADSFRVDDVSGDTTPFIIDKDGNVGIGTASPGAKLEVEGNIAASGSHFIIDRPDTTGGWARGIMYYPTGSFSGTELAGIGLLGSGTSVTRIYLAHGDNPWASTAGVHILTNGNVGIGTTGPGEKLVVSGGDIDVRADTPRVRVTDTGESNKYIELRYESGWGRIYTDGSNIYTNRMFRADGGLRVGDDEGFYRNAEDVVRTGDSFIVDGNVGIGTTEPQDVLDLGNATAGRSLVFQKYAALGTQYSSADVVLGRMIKPKAGEDVSIYSYTGTYKPSAIKLDGTGDIKFATQVSGSYTKGDTFDFDANTKMIIMNNGNVGIGTTDPGSYKLKVAGNTEVTGDLTIGGKLNINESGDLAEEFVADKELAAGTVVIIGDQGYKSVQACGSEYDSKVIGIISANPAMIMGKDNGKNKVIVAMIGVVKVKVTESNGPIKKGDLLVTSSQKGHAMRATELKIGTIIGKALEDSNKREDEIMALINLQ